MRFGLKILGGLLIALGLYLGIVNLIAMWGPTDGVSIWFRLGMGLFMFVMAAIPIHIGVRLWRKKSAAVARAVGQAAGLALWISLTIVVQQLDVMQRWVIGVHRWLPDMPLVDEGISCAISLIAFVGPILLAIQLSKAITRRLAPVLARKFPQPAEES